MRPIVRVQNLSKEYRINPRGVSTIRYDTLRESIASAIRAPIRRITAGGADQMERIWALRDVSFEVMPGEVLGIIGPNGAGKSTLLSVLSRIVEPTSGRVELYGKVASLLEVGTGFHPDLSGVENIYLNGAVLGMKRREIEDRFDEIVEFAGIERFLDTAVKRYSSGMYVRLAFAVAAHLNPDILIVDEVLAVGDAAFQRKCLGKMDEVTKSGRTVLLVSHSMSVVRQLCERAILIADGRLHMTGSAGAVTEFYENLVADQAREES